MSVNHVTLIGRLGQDPELKYTPSGVPVVSFSLATSDKWKDKDTGEAKEKVEWHRCVAWNKLAENINQFTKKGSQLYVEGKLQTRSWDDKDGVKRYTTEILANAVQFLDSKNTSDSRPPHPAEEKASKPTSNSPATEATSLPTPDFDPSELPF